MATSSDLNDRIEAEFSAADDRIQKLKNEQVQAFQSKQQRLEQLGQLLEQLREIWRPRLELLAKKFGEKISARPQIEHGKRTATFDVKSDVARITLRFSAAPDVDVRTLTFKYDLEIIPILMKFDSHDEIEFPVDNVDTAALGKWFDDRIVSFVRTYFAIHENQFYLKDHLVEDPVAKIKFPKYAAGATAEVGGKTYYFIDEATCREFQQEK